MKTKVEIEWEDIVCTRKNKAGKKTGIIKLERSSFVTESIDSKVFQRHVGASDFKRTTKDTTYVLTALNFNENGDSEVAQKFILLPEEAKSLCHCLMGCFNLIHLDRRTQR